MIQKKVNLITYQNIIIIDPQSPYNGQCVDIVIEGNIIQQITPSVEQNIRNEQLYISTGWFDMQVHLAEPGFEQKETLTELAKAAALGGFTGILCYPNTNPVMDNAQVLRSVKQFAQNVPIEILFSGALSHHAEGKEMAEIYEMHANGAVAFTDGINSIQSSGLMLRLRQYMQPFDGLMILMPSDKSLAAEGQMNEGRYSVLLGMKGVPEIAEAVAVAKELYLHEYAPLRTHFQPISSPKALELLGKAKPKFDNISVGIPIYYFVFQDKDLTEFDNFLKVFPPLRSENQVEELKKALTNGVIDVLTSGHQAQGLEEKELEFEIAEAGMLSLQTFFPLVNEFLLQTGVISLEKFVELASIRPREILKLPKISIKEGEKANLTVFSLTQKWTLSAKEIPSTAKNSPLLGKELTGKVVEVIY